MLRQNVANPFSSLPQGNFLHFQQTTVLFSFSTSHQPSSQIYESPKLQKSSIIQSHLSKKGVYYFNKIFDMSDSDQMISQMIPVPSPKHSCETLTEGFPLLREALLCQPDDAFGKIKEISLLSEEAWKSMRKFGTVQQIEVGDLLLEQFKKVTNWTVNHLDLFNQLKAITKSFWLDLNKLYRTYLFQKVENGLDFMEIVQGLEGVPIKRGLESRIPMPFDGSLKPQIKEFQNCYQVITTQSLRDNPDYAIYVKRYVSLKSEEEKLKYKLRLMKQLLKGSGPSQMPPPMMSPYGIPHQLSNKKQEIFTEVQKVYALLGAIESPWLLEELLRIQCPLTNEYKKSIYALKLVRVQGEEQRVILSEHPKIKSKLITQNVLKLCLKIGVQDDSNLLDLCNTIEANGKIYLKYDITQLPETTILFVRNIHMQPGEQAVNQTKIRENFLTILTRIYSIIRNTTQSQQILIYQAESFTPLPSEKSIDVLLFCIKIISKLIDLGKVLKVNNIISQILITPQFIANMNIIMKFIATKSDPLKVKQIFLLICNQIQELVVKNEQKMVIMNNAQFFECFIEQTNSIISDPNAKVLEPRLQSFLINYLQKLFEFGLNTTQIKLDRIYQLKLNNLGQQNERPPMEFYAYMHHMPHQDREAIRNRFKSSKFQDFISVFPESLTYFQQKLVQSVSDISKELESLDIFDSKCSEKFKYLLKLFSSEKIQSTEKLSEEFKALLKANSAIFSRHSENINWKNFKEKININDQLIYSEITNTLSKLKQNFAVESIEVSQLCQKTSTVNKDVINQVNMLIYLQLLLKMREKNPAFPYIKQLMEINLFMEKMESLSLNKIVKYQATYSPQKLKEIRSFYRGGVSDKIILHFKLAKISSELAGTCWQIFGELDIPHTNTFLKEYKMYFQTMKSQPDKNLILKLLKRTYRNIREINNSKRMNLSYQLYNHNKDVIFQLLSELHEQIGDKKGHFDAVVMGDSYLRFIEKCQGAGKDPALQFSIIIRPHIQNSIKEFLDWMVFKVEQGGILFNNKSYTGQAHILNVVRTILCDIIQRINRNFSLSALSFYSQFIKIIENKGLRPMPGQIQQENNVQIELPEEPLVLITNKEQKDKKISTSYIEILNKILEIRYNKASLNQIQSIYLILVEKLSVKYNTPHQQQPMLTLILKEIGQKSQNVDFDEQLFKCQCTWINKILNTVKDFKLEEVLTDSFIKNYLKLAIYMLNNPEEYKESLANSISILEKFIPRIYTENRSQLISFGHGIVQLIIKIINCSASFEQFDYQIIKLSAQTLIKTKCPEYNQQIISLIKVLRGKDINIGPLLCQLIEKETQIASMQADIKGFFLKESQNLVDQSQQKISIRLTTFITTFKTKYQADVTTFSNLTSKFVKKSTKTEQKKEPAYLLYDKASSFSYSQILKKEFIAFEPSDHIKIIIRDILSFKDSSKLNGCLNSLRDLFYSSPLIIPYVLLHPIETGEGQVQFIDYLITEISTKRSESINKFLLFSCLDHSCIVKLKERTIFFSEYLCYRIIKQIVKLGINKYTLLLIYYLSQLKRFAYLCKIKLSKSDKKSLTNVLIDSLKTSREGYHYKNSFNNVIYLIMAIIFKQDGIDNLKKCFIPKKPIEFERSYKLINECLIPYNVFYRKLKNQNTFQSREDNIAFTGNLITPFYSEIYDEIYMDEDYAFTLPKYEQLKIENISEIMEIEYLFENIDQRYLKSLSLAKTTTKLRDTELQLRTSYNERHQSMIARIIELYFKDDPQDNSEKRKPRNPMSDRNLPWSQQEDQDAFQRRRGRRHLRGHARGVGGPHRLTRRNEARGSRYAQEDFYRTENALRQQKKTIQKEFEQSLSIIPSQQMIPQQQSSSNFDDIKTGDEQFQNILNEINDKLFLLGKQPLNEAELRGKTYIEKRAYIDRKEAEIDFDYNKNWLSPREFEEYMLINAHKFSNLDSERKEEVRKAEEKMFTFNLQRSPSSDSINYMIDTIDENYQHITNIKKALSRSQSLSSHNEQMEIQPENFSFENNKLPFRAFSDIQEETLYEMLLSFYYVCPTFASKQFMPFLENKKVQNLLINTLLYLMKDPFSHKCFPNCIFSFNQKQLTWKPFEITSSNLESERKNFIERVLPVFQSVKNYSFYQNDFFLLEEISNEGIFDIKYEASRRNQLTNSYIPIYQILEHSFNASKSFSIELLKGVKELPEHLGTKILDVIVKSEIQPENTESQNVFVMGRVYQRPQRKATNKFPYQSLKQLFKNPNFQAQFKDIYKFGVKDPSPALLLHLIDSNIYSLQELRTLHLKLLITKAEDPNSLKFLNKIIQIYSDQELKEAKWVRQYRETLAKILEYLNATQTKVSNEPISRIFKLTNDLGFQIKRIIFEKQMNQRRQEINFDFEQVQRSGVISKKQKGIFESAFQDLRSKPDNFWLSTFGVRFMNENGTRESGFGDGVRREWFTILSKAMVNLNYALFRRTPKNYYFFNKQSYINSRHLQYFEFIGKLFGYSLTKSSIFVSPSFSILLYKMILEEEITINDILQEFQEEAEYVKSIERLVNWAKCNEDVIGADLTFVYIDKRLFSNENSLSQSPKKGKILELVTTSEYVIKELHTEQEQKVLPNRTKVIAVNEIIELKPGGSQIKVTFDNMHEYLELTKQKIYELVAISVKKQSQAFIAGFRRVVSPKLLSRFSSDELRLLVEGISEISIGDLQKYTRNINVDETTTALLWGALEDLSNQDRGLFLWNWTGVDKMPAEGAKIMGLSINPSRGQFFIAHTCPKSLQVPKCQTKQEMETAVTIVLNNIKSGAAIIED